MTAIALGNWRRRRMSIISGLNYSLSPPLEATAARITLITLITLVALVALVAEIRPTDVPRV